ncbi:hypothetical protein EC960427_3403, partial [Escherichia coli 96.0427]
MVETSFLNPLHHFLSLLFIGFSKNKYIIIDINNEANRAIT